MSAASKCQNVTDLLDLYLLKLKLNGLSLLKLPYKSTETIKELLRHVLTEQSCDLKFKKFGRRLVLPR